MLPEPIARRLPLAAGLLVVLCGAVVAAHAGDATRLVLGVVLVAFLVPIALIDLDTRLIPNALTLPAAVLAVAIGLSLDAGGEPERLIAGAAAGGFLLLAALARPDGMGMGDVKLAGVMGLALGRGVIPAMLVGFVVGTVAGLGIVARRGLREGRKATVPFGPYLALGGVVGALAGEELADLYLDTL